MTALKDDDYIKEVTQSLCQSIVSLLQTRPHDPIDYLAQCLHTYRRNHPRRDQPGRNERRPTGDPVTSRDDSLKPDLVLPQISTNNMSHIIITAGGVEEEDEISQIRNQYIQMDFVHKEFSRTMFEFGDLFDDDDYG